MTPFFEPETKKTAERKIGERLVVSINDIAFGGEGVAREEDFVIFVPFALLNEEVEVELTEIKKRFARSHLVRVVRASPDRTTPLCRYFGECGGCQYQHIDYTAQLRLKQKQIADIFQRIGGFPEAVRDLIDPVIPCPEPYGYRNRIMIRSQWDKFKQGLNIGFIRHDNRLVVDIEECKIAEPALNEQIRSVRMNPPPKGGLKVVLRIAPEGWEVPKDSFFQNNFFLVARLVETVRERVRLNGTRHLIDAYCGVGFFGIELADMMQSLVGVESDSLAIQAARRNAKRRGRTNIEFVAGRVEEALPALLTSCPPENTTILLDPPRTGCAERTLELLRRSSFNQIIYVSCQPATLARDLKTLCAGSLYQLSKVAPLDMFPQTQHIECVADLRKHASAPPSCS